MPQLPKPARPHISGSTTPCTSAQAIAASTALPPALKMSAPASVASGCAATIIARLRYRMVGPPPGSAGHRLDRLHLVGGERQRRARQVLRHVLAAGGAGQRQHADREGEAEYHLRRGGPLAPPDPPDHWVAHHLRLGGHQPQSPLDHPLL